MGGKASEKEGDADAFGSLPGLSTGRTWMYPPLSPSRQIAGASQLLLPWFPFRVPSLIMSGFPTPESDTYQFLCQFQCLKLQITHTSNWLQWENTSYLARRQTLLRVSWVFSSNVKRLDPRVFLSFDLSRHTWVGSCMSYKPQLQGFHSAFCLFQRTE